MRQVVPEIRIARIGQPGTPPRGTPDPDVLVYCEANKLVFVTCDRGTLYGHMGDHPAAGREFWGAMTLDKPVTTEELVSDLVLIYETSSAESYVEVVQSLPL